MRIRAARLSDAAAIAQVRVDTWRTAYRGLLPDGYLQGLSVDTHTENWRRILSADGRQGYSFVAEDESGQVIGFAICGPERDDDPTYAGELYALYLLESQHGKGYGRRLVQTAAMQLQAKRMNSMLVWVLGQNPARKFYEHLGGRFYRKKKILIGSEMYQEVSYGWDDLLPLIADRSKPEPD